MSQILPVVYSSYTPLYFPSFESRLSSSNLFSELSLSFVLALYLILRNLGQEGNGRHNTYVEAKVLSSFKFCFSEFYFESIFILFRFLISTPDKLRLSIPKLCRSLTPPLDVNIEYHRSCN